MKKRCVLRILGLLLGLVHMVNLAACSPSPTPTATRVVTLTPTRAARPTPTRTTRPTPTQELSVTITAPSPVASEPVDLLQVLDQWDAQRIFNEERIYEVHKTNYDHINADYFSYHNVFFC